MRELLEKVEKELNAIAQKGITSSNLDSTYKLVDIYKDIKESKYYETQSEGSYDARMRDSMGRYMGGREDYGRSYDRNYGRGGEWTAEGRYNTGGMDRYLTRMADGLDNYNYGKERYMSGDNQDRMVDGIEMVMSAVCMFVEDLANFAETPQEKEIIRKHLSKMKQI